MADGSGRDDALSTNYKEVINKTSNATINPLVWQSSGEVGVAIYGYLFTAVASVTFFINIISFVVLTRTINPVNMMLSAIAVYDWITCLVMQPMLIFFFLLGNHSEWVPYDWCMTFKVTLMYIPATFHTASLWTTVAMAAQRYFVVRKPFLKHFVTKKLTLILIIGALVIGFAVNSLRMFDSSFEAVVVPSKKNSSILMLGCVEKYAQWISDPTSYFSTFFIVKTSFQNFLPTIALFVLNGLLIREVRVGKRLSSGRDTVLSLSANQMKSVESTSTRITFMLIAVLVTNLCAETPMGIMIALIISAQLGFPVLDPLSLSAGILVADTIMTFSYPVNFLIYYAISSNFRKTFVELFCPRAAQGSSRPRTNEFKRNKTGSSNSASTSQSSLHI